MIQRPVDGGGAGRVVGHEQHASQPQTGHDRVEVAELVGERVIVVAGLVRLAPAQEVEHHQVPPAQVRDQPVVEMVVIGEAVHQHDGWLLTGLLPDVEAVATTLDPALLESVGPLGRRLHVLSLAACGSASHQ